MLILTRRVGESIIIETPASGRIQVTVLGIKGNQVRIGTDVSLGWLVYSKSFGNFKSALDCSYTLFSFPATPNSAHFVLPLSLEHKTEKT